MAKIDTVELAKQLLGVAADIAVPGVRERVEEIIKLTREGVSAGLPTTVPEIESVLMGLSATPEFQMFLQREILNMATGKWADPSNIPEPFRSYALYSPAGIKVFGPTQFPGNIIFSSQPDSTLRVSAPAEAAKQLVPPSASTPTAAASVITSLVTQADSGFKFGSKSLAELAGVHPSLVQMATLALKYSTQDFMVYDGLRTLAEQQAYVAKGTSKTLDSKHRVQSDGLGHAVDLVPYAGGQPRWDWNLIYPVVLAVDKAATEMGIASRIIWGGAWDRTLADFGGDADAYAKVVADYVSRRKAAGYSSAFIDGPHFEIKS